MEVLSIDSTVVEGVQGQLLLIMWHLSMAHSGMKIHDFSSFYLHLHSKA